MCKGFESEMIFCVFSFKSETSFHRAQCIYGSSTHLRAIQLSSRCNSELLICRFYFYLQCVYKFAAAVNGSVMNHGEVEELGSGRNRSFADIEGLIDIYSNGKLFFGPCDGVSIRHA